MIVDIKKMISKKEEELVKRLAVLKQKNKIPKIVFIVANEDEASKSYIRSKIKICDKLGIKQEEIYFTHTCSEEEVVECIKKLNQDKAVTGILVQLPIYHHLNVNTIVNSIKPSKDVDGFHTFNVGSLYSGCQNIIPCTPKGIMSILDELGIELSGKYVVVIGRSNIVGKPIAQLLLQKDSTVTICHSKTRNLKEYTKEADILIVAAGISNLVTKDMIKKDSVIIDVGINRVKDKIVGDVATIEVAKKAKYVTPVPGGVGPMTIISLIENLVEMVENSK
ncbi:MAG: bifunctional 5,10-methylenetetrahydrofolate dehydrogenase/5,10-methenyltetrahydrofolate cyclohydrolase [Clostridia bacterium]|nr:bifunctional 5,10-methylenetetrahydrofolate dehydrogenase/5,10-methenyltetrahydrofolate cyclohydrolase [Clostridia bacterium]